MGQAKRTTTVVNDINVTLIPTRVSRVSGIVVDAQGRPNAGGMVMVVQRQGTNGFSMNTARVNSGWP